MEPVFLNILLVWVLNPLADLPVLDSDKVCWVQSYQNLVPPVLKDLVNLICKENPLFSIVREALFNSFKCAPEELRNDALRLLLFRKRLVVKNTANEELVADLLDASLKAADPRNIFVDLLAQYR